MQIRMQLYNYFENAIKFTKATSIYNNNGLMEKQKGYK